MSDNKLLTKSKFQLAMDCPTKLYYAANRDYANARVEDPFLQALASGGHQVGALAQCYFPDGIRVRTQNHLEALRLTNELLARENVVIFEAAFEFGTCYLRADIVVKQGNVLELIEVKAKSCDFADESAFWNRNGTIAASFESHIYDIAFQKYVVQNARPDLEIKAFLMLADKTAACPTDGLNQKFRITRDAEGRRAIVVSDELSDADLSPWLMRKIAVDQSCEKAYAAIEAKGTTFAGHVSRLAESLLNNEKIAAPISSACKECEFRVTEADAHRGMKSGFRECWSAQLGWSDADFSEPTVLDIWDFRRKDKMLAAGKIKMSDISIDDIGPKTDGGPGIHASERQWKQVEKVQTRDTTPWIDTDGLREKMSTWTFPLHFIDFETSAPAIPFKAGRRPYEQVAFQFSHHIVDEDGRVSHRGEFLSAVPGAFPNYDLVRMLKLQLEGDAGTIFRYASHENSILNAAYRQLREDPSDISDREELCEFIKSITRSTGRSEEVWAGERKMVDMHTLVKRHYYHPACGGSISIKYVLPAVLGSSAFLQEKYSQPIYGSADGIISPNFTDHAWVQFDNGKVRDPYKLLPKLFSDESERDYEIISEMDRISDGGAALTAYSKLQLQEMSEGERTEIESALYKYCELDTLAMVMIYEAWKAEI